MATLMPETEYYKTTEVDPTAGAIGSATGTGVGLGIGAFLGWLAAPFTGGASVVASMAVGAGLGASTFGQIGGSLGMVAGEEEVEIPIGTSPNRPGMPRESAAAGLATQGWAWERIMKDMDKKDKLPVAAKGPTPTVPGTYAPIGDYSMPAPDPSYGVA